MLVVRFSLPDNLNSFGKSATTSRAGGMRMAPERGRGHLCWCSLIFKKEFLIGNTFNQLSLYLEYFRDMFISVLFAPLILARALTVEPLKFSSRQVGVAYELS
jgi:hypothetical protein